MNTTSITSPLGWREGRRRAWELHWDGATIHRNQEVQGFVAGVGDDRRMVIQLPGYAPELNPQEGIWHHLKQIELGNVICHTPAELREQLQAAIRRLRRKPDVIRG